MKSITNKTGSIYPIKVYEKDTRGNIKKDDQGNSVVKKLVKVVNAKGETVMTKTPHEGYRVFDINGAKIKTGRVTGESYQDVDMKLTQLGIKMELDAQDADMRERIGRAGVQILSGESVADAMLRSTAKQVDKEEYSMPTVGEYVTQRLAIRQRRVGDSTARTYGALANFITDSDLAAKRLDRFTADDVVLWVNSLKKRPAMQAKFMRKTGKTVLTPKGQPISSQSVKLAYQLLVSLIDEATKPIDGTGRRLLVHNVAQEADVQIKVVHRSKTEGFEGEDISGLDMIFNHLTSPRQKALVGLLRMGLRPGEACGVTHDDLYQEAGVWRVRVNKQLKRVWDVETGKTTIQTDAPTKRNKQRTLTVPEDLVPYVTATRGLGCKWVVCSSNGKSFTEPFRAYRIFKDLAAKAGMAQAFPYLMRSLFATDLEELGQDNTTKAALMGQSKFLPNYPQARTKAADLVMAGITIKNGVKA